MVTEFLSQSNEPNRMSKGKAKATATTSASVDDVQSFLDEHFGEIFRADGDDLVVASVSDAQMQLRWFGRAISHTGTKLVEDQLLRPSLEKRFPKIQISFQRARFGDSSETARGKKPTQ